MTNDEFINLQKKLREVLLCEKSFFGLRVKLTDGEIVDFYPKRENYTQWRWWKYFHMNMNYCYLSVMIHNNTNNYDVWHTYPASIIFYIDVIYPPKEDEDQLPCISW